MKTTPEGWVRLKGIPEMTEEQREELRALAASNRPIDTSDIPELDADFFKRATRGRPVRSKRPKIEPAE